MAALILVTLLSFLLHGVVSIDESDIGLNTVQMIENHGYVVETHHITTEDGYVLTYHRIPNGISNKAPAPKPPVLLMHGLMSSSADYVNMGPERSLGYILADLGYDVWIGNARGNAWSRNHTTLDLVEDAAEFFDFSWHEIGYYDLAAAVDHILEINGDDSLYYIGHSQGTTSFMVLASTRPEYNEKIKVALLMGPASYMAHQTNIILTVLVKHLDEIINVLTKYKIYEIPFPEKLAQLGFAICTQPENEDVCENVLGFIDGVDAEQLEYNIFPLILSNAPSNAAVKQVLHYGQLIKNGAFAQYDYGTEKNQELYGSDTPPAYDLSKITAPVGVYYGKGDGLVDYEDAETVVKNLGNVVDDYLISYEKFNHLDFLWAKDVYELLYKEMIAVMEKY